MRALRTKPQLPEQESDNEELKVTPLNNFALLQTDSSSESEADSDESECLDKVSATPGQLKQDDSDSDWEKLLTDFKQDQPIISEQQETVLLKNILGVVAVYLDPQVELKKMFGSVAVEEKAKKKGRRKRTIVKDGMLVKFKDTWPRLSKLGLSMEVVRVEGGNQSTRVKPNV